MLATPDEVPGERAGAFRRLFTVAVGVTLAGLGGATVWVFPGSFMGVVAVLPVTAGCVITFQGVSGRAEDLREFAPAKFVGEAAGEAAVALAAFAAIVAALLTCLR